MEQKNIERIMAPGTIHWVGNGFRVHNFIPGRFDMDMRRTDPFILLDYNPKYKFPAADKPGGVGVHPHRGFETVTIAYKGKVEHHDSHGGGGVIEEGDVQWMTAASGVLHKEFHEKEWSKNGGDFHMVQLWINLPAKDKMSAPKYQAIPNSKIIKVELPQNSGKVEVIAGEYDGEKGPASTFSPINLFNAHLNKEGMAPFSFPAKYNTTLLVIEGNITVNEKDTIPADHFVLFANKGENFSIKANEDSVVLIMSGEPLNEPIASHGPFVMNTKAELLQAFEDFNNGKFGELED